LNPFYPLIAKEKGLSIIEIGIVLSTMAWVSIAASFTMGKFMHFIGAGRQMVILGGSLLIMS